MDREPDCTCLCVSPFGLSRDGAPVYLVSALDALGLGRGGQFERVDPWRLVWDLHRCELGEGQLVDFLAGAHPFGGRERWLRAGDLIDEIVRGIERGSFVGVRRCQQSMRSVEASANERALARQIERAMGGHLRESGRQHRLVAGDDLPGVPDRGRFEVVARAEAERVLEVLATEAVPDLAETLRKARATLSPDWRPPLAPSGLVLLRRSADVPATVAAQEAPITPSQLRALVEKAWVEIEIVDEEGWPVSVAYALELPDGAIDQGDAPPDGLVSRSGVKPGVCKLTLPALDGALWKLG